MNRNVKIPQSFISGCKNSQIIKNLQFADGNQQIIRHIDIGPQKIYLRSASSGKLDSDIQNVRFSIN